MRGDLCASNPTVRNLKVGSAVGIIIKALLCTKLNRRENKRVGEYHVKSSHEVAKGK